ncbi:hypothetical protein D8B26_000358 [Coccidioides posadasii str. Silveira]|uniref:Uncharacterized protein n=2 Tax=Coccidioides posadasii TaxID=199306 RepID=E9D8I0_COCPS|nr:hypothetical protein CPC735_064680 [Coccidioides posadasii C735 delta SOWgp]EER25368.1 hypothetical protein CPC735_064680 [Coccidioides posadasii C735 delta SOWgp]EFW17689.1 conserved hypothetical protein [Coccidioides posadasii str. Silveira]QVM05651.1 hypothetical protein D8B26_000358 [Coccidioides posadasii str. Silveira]|eukprot:XP_003067513.1 hypothetical protein CPC735_064680 [Coccidioides posadasii C735 delta SOWgp]
MDAQQQPPTTGPRARPKLPPIQTSVNRRTSMRPKPPPPELVTGSTSADRVPLKAPKPETSKSSLRSLINKTKSIRHNSPKSASSQSLIVDSKPFTNVSPMCEDQVTPTSTKQSSKITKSYSESTVPSLANGSLNSTPKLSKSVKERKDRAITNWKPPPLFKAYPQAIKHAVLSAPNMSAEAILRIQELLNQESRENSSTIDSKGRKDHKHVMKATDTIHKIEWSRKIYMLVTSGYLLQYSADGSFDRLPELVLELGENSVAFASDALPGKHWVLQISHTFDENGTTAVDNKRGFLSRLRLSDSPKMTQSLLLVLDNANELAAWLITMRREIEGLRGQEYVPETPMVDETPQPLHRYRSMASMRKPATKDRRRASDQNKNSIANRSLVSVSSSTLSPSTLSRLDGLAVVQANRRSMARSIEAPSPSTATTGSDFDRLKDNCRLSYASIGTRTISSSCGSSPPSSSAGPKYAMTKSSFGSPEGFRSEPNGPLLDTCSRPISTVRGPSCLRPESGTLGQPRPEYVSPQVVRPVLMSTPNFSVPVFSKRYSSAVNVRSSQPRSITPVPNVTPAAAVAQLSCYDSETSIDSSPEGLAPIEQGARTKMYPHIARDGVRPSSVRSRHSAIGTSDAMSRQANQLKTHQLPPRRYSTSEHSVDMYSPVSGGFLVPPAINKESEKTVQETPQYRWPLLTGTESTACARHPRGDGTTSLRRPLSLQAKTPRVLPSEHPPMTLIPQSTQNPKRLAISNLSTAARYPPIPPPQSFQTQASRAVAISNVPKPLRYYPPPPPSRSSHVSNLSPKRSLPQMAFGPPPAPPPNCPLPEIPPASGPRRTPSWTSPTAAMKRTHIPVPQTHVNGDQRVLARASPGPYRASVPAINASGLTDMRATKKSGILQAC